MPPSSSLVNWLNTRKRNILTNLNKITTAALSRVTTASSDVAWYRCDSLSNGQLIWRAGIDEDIDVYTNIKIGMLEDLK